MTHQITDIKLDRSLITTIRQDPILHIPPNLPGSAQKNALAGSRLLTNQPDITSGNASSTPKHTWIPGETLKIISVQLRLNSLLCSKITTPGQVQCNNKHHAQRAPLRNTNVPSPRLSQGQQPASTDTRTCEVKHAKVGTLVEDLVHSHEIMKLRTDPEPHQDHPE